MNDAEDVRAYNPGVPEPVALVIARALARDRAERFQDAREFLDALRSGGALISSRGGEDGFVVSSDPALMPVSSGRTPSSALDRRRATPITDPALENTVKFHSTPPPDRARISALTLRRRAEAARRRRTFVLVAVSALLAGGLGAFVVTRTWVRPVRDGERTVQSAPLTTLATPPESPLGLVGEPGPTTTPTVEPVASSLPDAPEPRFKPSPWHAPPPSSAAGRPQIPAPKPSGTTTPASGVAPGLRLHLPDDH
jgi:serine/threonine-protein kinase